MPCYKLNRDKIENIIRTALVKWSKGGGLFMSKDFDDALIDPVMFATDAIMDSAICDCKD